MSGYKHTFGKTKAAIILAEKIENDTKAINDIGRLLHVFSESLKELSKTKPSVRANIAVILLHHNKDIAANYPTDYNTYLSNTISFIYKNWALTNIDNKPHI